MAVADMEDYARLEIMCRSILDLDPLMRSAWIINNRGHAVAGGMKSGLKSLEDTKNDEILFTELSLRVRMRHEFDQELGAVHFSMSHREKVIVISFPLADNWVALASAEHGLNLSRIPFKILDIVGELRKSTG